MNDPAPRAARKTPASGRLLIEARGLSKNFYDAGREIQVLRGLDFKALEAAFKALPFDKEKPSVIIADTVRGKGLPSIEARADRWFCNFTHEEVGSLLKELHGDATTDLQSETLTVR